MTDGKTGLITPGLGGGGIEPYDPDWPREGFGGCDGHGLFIEGVGG